MMFTTPMKLLVAAVLREDGNAVAAELLELGIMDAIAVRELSGDWTDSLESAKPDARFIRTSQLRRRTEGFFALAEPPLPLPELTKLKTGTLGSPIIDLTAAERSLDALASSMNEARERQKTVQSELLRLEDMRKQLESMSGFESAGQGGGRSFLDLRTGTVNGSRVAGLERALSGIPSVVLKNDLEHGSKVAVMVITLKRDSARVMDTLRREGWEESSMPGSADKNKEEILREIGVKENALKAERAERGDELRTIVASQAEHLRTLWSSLRADELGCRVRSGFSTTERTTMFSGWIPASDEKRVEQAIKSASKNHCYLEWLLPDGGEAKGLSAPVAMNNPPLLKPFQNLVSNYAMPEYGTIDPTPFVAIAYLCMFGLMFGDAGHGLVLILVGLLGLARARKKGAKEDLYKLILYCGGAAIVSGLLFGSIFGQKILPPLWFDYHGIVSGSEETIGGPVTSIYGILGITVRFGMIILALGMLLNWINLIRKRRWFALVFDKAGFLGAWIYAAGSWTAFFFVAHEYRELPPINLLAVLLGVPTLALALKAPLEFLRHRSHGASKFSAMTLMNFLLEWIVEVLEIYSGYLANTLSFMRVAGLGIAHVSLMVAFKQIAEMMSPDGGMTIAGIAILILGNMLVIALEGLSAGIQSLRLNYYEFFSKYFNGTGRAYRPISLRTKDKE